MIALEMWGREMDRYEAALKSGDPRAIAQARERYERAESRACDYLEALGRLFANFGVHEEPGDA